MKKRNLERMRYKNDKLASRLCLTAVVFDAVYFVVLYGRQSVVPDMNMGADILLNILFLLAGFFAAEQAKVYSRRWSFIMIGMALAQIARSFWLPEYYRALEQLIGGEYLTTKLSLLASAALMLAAGIVSYVNSTVLARYLDKSEA